MLLSTLFQSYHNDSSYIFMFFLGFTSIRLVFLSVLPKDTPTKRIQCGLNPRPLNYKSNTLPLSHTRLRMIISQMLYSLLNKKLSKHVQAIQYKCNLKFVLGKVKNVLGNIVLHRSFSSKIRPVLHDTSPFPSLERQYYAQ